MDSRKNKQDWITQSLNREIVPIRSDGYSAELVDPSGTTFVLSSPDKARKLECNNASILVWELVDGTRTLAEICEILSDHYSITYEEVFDDVIEIVDWLMHYGALLPPQENHPDVIIQTKWLGRFGNRMFTYAFGCHYARRFKLKYWLPSEWEGSTLFAPPSGTDVAVIPDHELRETFVSVDKDPDILKLKTGAIRKYSAKADIELSYLDVSDERNYGTKNFCFESLCMYWPWIFLKYSRQELREIFDFSDAVKSSQLYKDASARKGTYSVAHLRRGDISGDKYKGAHSVVSKESYLLAFEKFGIDPAAVEWITDDQSGDFGVTPTRHKSKWSFPEGAMPEPDIFFEFFPDFLKLYFAKIIFRANSSFSWWAASLSDAIIYSPVLTRRKNFAKEGEMHCEFVEGNHPHFMGCPDDGAWASDIIIDPNG